MSVRAKLQLVSITDHGTTSKTLKFMAQYDSVTPEDQRFQKATPSATAEFMIDNPKALEQFKIGSQYYVDFTPVD